MASNLIRKDGNCKLVQEIVTTTDPLSQPGLLTPSALNQIASRIKNANNLKEPQNFIDYIVPDKFNYCNVQ